MLLFPFKDFKAGDEQKLPQAPEKVKACRCGAKLIECPGEFAPVTKVEIRKFLNNDFSDDESCLVWQCKVCHMILVNMFREKCSSLICSDSFALVVFCPKA